MVIQFKDNLNLESIKLFVGVLLHNAKRRLGWGHQLAIVDKWHLCYCFRTGSLLKGGLTKAHNSDMAEVNI